MISNVIYARQPATTLESFNEQHSANDRTPYCYLIGWTEHNIWYYGRRTGKNCHPSDFWEKYFTSSKLVKEFRATHGEPDVIEIRRVFTNIRTCCKWETRVLTKLNAARNLRFLNQTNGDEKYDTTGKTAVIDIDGKTRLVDCETYRLNSHVLINHRTGKTYEQISGEIQGKIRRESITGENNPFYGKTHTEETISKIKEKLSGENNIFYGKKGPDHPKFGHIESLDTRHRKSVSKQGMKNNRALIINIYNSNDVLMVTTYGNFIEVCELNKLPTRRLQYSYRNNTKVEYYTKCKHASFHGWYARIVKI